MESRKYLIGICDDDEWYRNRISHAVNLICQQTDILYELRTYDSGEAVLSEEGGLDILFLDEELADGKEHRLNGKDVRTYFEAQVSLDMSAAAVGALILANIAFPPSIIITIIGGGAALGMVNFYLDYHENFESMKEWYAKAKVYGKKL